MLNNENRKLDNFEVHAQSGSFRVTTLGLKIPLSGFLFWSLYSHLINIYKVVQI
jgi:hypothetical protein